MGVGPAIAAVTATLDLELVRLLRAAMAGGGVCAGQGISPTPAIEPRKRYEPEPRIEPRHVITPTPRFEGRVVYHPQRVEPAGLIGVGGPPAEPEKPCSVPSPIQPPWKQMPWQKAPVPPPELKIVFRPPDVPRKGTVFDVFI